MFGWGKPREPEPEVTLVVEFQDANGQVVAEDRMIKRGAEWANDPDRLPYLPGCRDGLFFYPVKITHESLTQRRLIYRHELPKVCEHEFRWRVPGSVAYCPKCGHGWAGAWKPAIQS